jgi:caffeoyl-CoA O-methyltransferase
MEFIDPVLQKYSDDHSSAESQLLKKISRDTHSMVMKPRMLSGHMQGRFLSMISKMIGPKNVLEVGTYTGYSALCLAEGLQPEGILVTIDINEELESRVRSYFKQSPYGAQIDYRIGNALEIIPQLKGAFDLVFIDADKENYPNYYDLVIDKIRTGGIILADNVLWSGKVIKTNPDKDTRNMQAFNDKVNNDPRVENVLLPLRDGISVIRKL